VDGLILARNDCCWLHADHSPPRTGTSLIHVNRTSLLQHQRLPHGIVWWWWAQIGHMAADLRPRLQGTTVQSSGLQAAANRCAQGWTRLSLRLQVSSSHASTTALSYKSECLCWVSNGQRQAASVLQVPPVLSSPSVA
jgi:hypothetical protein